ncbi:MAG: pyridoxal-phosphate dependent enzyme [Acidobacteria bacterium]|nr:pyridoxal-phosphate dependent enzyme [Acidobacteriota bacterium]MCA1621225.1 pyridoxal-phosphate dependent enzyme [Acidobacteriota bacterium]
MLNLEFIREAGERIRPFVHRTPVVTSRTFDEAAGRRVFFKCENLQRAGAFKMRGATNKIRALSPEERARGVVAFSSGNHAQAVALASRDAGVRAVIVMPSDAPRTKLAATRGYGAEVVTYDRQLEDREEVARRVSEREGLSVVPPYDDYHVAAGQGTCALELFEEVPDLDALLTPCGGGGLFAGASVAAKALRPGVRCFPVESELSDDTRQSFIKGERVTIPPPATVADGMRTQTPGALTFPVLRANAEDVLTVSEDEIVETLRFLLFRLKILVEPTGAVAAAAALFGKLPPDVGRVGVVLSGGNVDPEALARFVAPTMA